MLQRGEVGAGLQAGAPGAEILQVPVLRDVMDMHGSKQTRSDSSCILLPLTEANQGNVQ